MNNILDGFVLPDGAEEAIARANMQAVSLGDGVTKLSGFSGGNGISFETKWELNEKKTREEGYEVYDEYDICIVHASRRHQPAERVRLLKEPKFIRNRAGDIIGGDYFQAYKNFKEKKDFVGIPLDGWRELSKGEAASLAAEGVYTVEQFADMPADKVLTIFPKKFVEAHKKAVAWVEGGDDREASAKAKAELDEVKKQNAELMERLQALENIKVDTVRRKK